MRRIFVVEDRDTAVHQLKQSLEGKGYEVSIARRGREALDIVAQQRVDLVLQGTCQKAPSLESGYEWLNS